ncbi:hypothetical protein LguiA_023701 [Lonicera macranthoides]
MDGYFTLPGFLNVRDPSLHLDWANITALLNASRNPLVFRGATKNDAFRDHHSIMPPPPLNVRNTSSLHQYIAPVLRSFSNVIYSSEKHLEKTNEYFPAACHTTDNNSDIWRLIEEGCRTPKHGSSKIPAASICPPMPRKKPIYANQRTPPKNGYFKPPDLETFFAGNGSRHTEGKLLHA